MVPVVQVWVAKEGKSRPWMRKFVSVVKSSAMKAAKADKKGVQGLAEVGAYSEQNAWSDDSYLAIRADHDELAKLVLDAAKKALPVGGGGVPGSRGYRGSGAKGGSGEYAYHWHSFGIGD
jgi:hypothetical protein